MPDFAIVLTGPALTESQIAGAADAFADRSGGKLHLLHEGKAAEVTLNCTEAAARQLRGEIRQLVGDAPVDVNLVPNDASRRKRLLVADMDSTIIQQECIDEIAAAAGVGDAVAEITERAMRGELDFEQALEARLAMLEGLDVATLDGVADSLIVTTGARELVQTMRANGAYCALVSGGFTFFTRQIAERVGFDEHRANTLAIEHGKLTGKAVAPILGRAAKQEALEELTATHKLAGAQTLAVGDGANDLAMIEAAGLGVAFHAKPVVAAEADAQIMHSDLTALLYLQGFSAEEIVD